MFDFSATGKIVMTTLFSENKQFSTLVLHLVVSFREIIWKISIYFTGLLVRQYYRPLIDRDFSLQYNNKLYRTHQTCQK